MKHTLNASITPKTAAKLILINEIDPSDCWSYDNAFDVMNEICDLSTDEILKLIDCQSDTFLDSNMIPQFGSLESLDKVPFILSETGISSLSYAQLGYYLKQDINAKMDANVKFGENHGKGTTILGLTKCVDGKFSLSPLGSVYCDIDDPITRRDIIIKLYLKIPIVQIILRHSLNEQYNGYDAMPSFSDKTKMRRGQCLRKIFKALRLLDEEVLNNRLDNIYWKI